MYFSIEMKNSRKYFENESNYKLALNIVGPYFTSTLISRAGFAGE